MAGKEGNFIFLKESDALAVAINNKAATLFTQLQHLDTTALDISDHFKDYFVQHHLGNRLHFSLQNSAHIIYQAVKKTGKQIENLCFADYGAGLGTLYMLAGMLNFRRVVYNDYLPDWKNCAASICKALNIDIDAYITGDIDNLLQYATDNKFRFDIIASRNVIEHIYSLPFFYTEVYRHNSDSIIFSTTSANFHNPAMRLKHYLLHLKIEKTQYLPYRKNVLKQEWPAITEKQLTELSTLTRGKAKGDFLVAIEDYKNNRAIKPVAFLRSNTCLPDTGYWCEHLLSKDEYRSIINNSGFAMDYTAGYWDTNYRYAAMNILGNFLNIVIGVFGKRACFFSPFVNVVAFKKH
jgi:2-polyprenyl-3-methyl-5-hydroxy-6-metoxy-1,4-benzoquinol methylase